MEPCGFHQLQQWTILDNAKGRPMEQPEDVNASCASPCSTLPWGLETLEVDEDLQKQLQWVYEQRQRRKDQRKRMTSTSIWRHLLCKVIGHAPSGIIYCGDVVSESECVHCHAPIQGNMLDEWWIDRAELERVCNA